MSLTDAQVRDAALNAVDSFLDSSIDRDDIAEGLEFYFENGWAGFDEDGEWVSVQEVWLGPEDVDRVQEEANAILAYVRDRTDGYYDS